MKIGKDGRAVMRNWCFGTDLWIMELVHKNQGVPEQQSGRCARIQQGYYRNTNRVLTILQESSVGGLERSRRGVQPTSSVWFSHCIKLHLSLRSYDPY